VASYIIMYYIYVLKSKRDNKLYIGYTNNLKRRLKEHNDGLVAITKHRKPFKLIFYEAFSNQQDATAREKFLKTGWGRRHLQKALKNYFAGR